jgi:hypothetical protein
LVFLENLSTAIPHVFLELTDAAVVINLTAENVDSSFRYPDRRLVLTTSKKSMPIGRTSRRAAEFAPRIDNGFFDNPVISRQHAELIADLYFEVRSESNSA